MTEKPSRPRACALDLGKSRVGVAIADELGMLAHPRPPLDGRDKKQLLSALAELAREEGIGLFLIGLPLDMSGQAGAMATRAFALAQEIKEATGVPFELYDERWTTVEASRMLRESGVSGRNQKNLVDGMSAAVMLQSYLDRGRGSSAAPMMMPSPPMDRAMDRAMDRGMDRGRGKRGRR